ncbi:NAD(P)-dependent oxidoreductase [Amycolatopsis ultiminotia]|uniref:NAD(P)-dependent oxidoreductase n=1 Tax=Amycolatopsis ultiminotia TaxID=543629 RepID=A0ABP6YH76_9PSEU
MTATRVAVLGLGIMGAGMVRALCAAGHPVTVYNRTRAKAEALSEFGAVAADSPAKAVSGAEVVLLSLADEAAVEEVLFGQLVGCLAPEQAIVDTSTVSPEFAREAAERLAAQGLRRVEACVVGNPQMAAGGALRVFIAGELHSSEPAHEVLDTLSQSIVHLGSAGRASSLKLAFNLLLGVQTAGLAEAVLLAEASGIDRNVLLEALDTSGWRSPVLSFRSRFMRERSYRPAGFRSTLMHKDLLLAQQEAAAHDTALPVTECAADRFRAAIETGHGDDDAAVVVDA